MPLFCGTPTGTSGIGCFSCQDLRFFWTFLIQCWSRLILFIFQFLYHINWLCNCDFTLANAQARCHLGWWKPLEWFSLVLPRVGLGSGALLTVLPPSLFSFPSLLPVLELGPWLCCVLQCTSWATQRSLDLEPLLHLPLGLLLLLTIGHLCRACRRICMSESNLVPVLRLAVSQLRQLADTLESALPPIAARAGSVTSATPTEWDLISEATPTDPAEVSGQATHRAYNDVAQRITAAPPACRELGARLGSSEADSEARVQRAWEAGIWAGAVLSGRVPKPRPTPKLSLRPVVYIILRGPSISSPTRVSSAAEYYRLIPRFTEDSLSHSFPSIAEAKIYCIAAGVDFPPAADQWRTQFRTLQTWELSSQTQEIF